MAGTGRVAWLFRACLFHHCASVPPALRGRHSHSGSRTPYLGIGRQWSRSDRLPETGVFVKNPVSHQYLAGKVDGFCGVQSNNYWSSTTNANNTDNAWLVNLNNGNVNNDNKTNTNYVWPVRGGE